MIRYRQSRGAIRLTQSSTRRRI